ncbi:MAG: hypothetical protein AB7N76_05715 [Planctomycetota bacterium]
MTSDPEPEQAGGPATEGDGAGVAAAEAQAAAPAAEVPPATAPTASPAKGKANPFSAVIVVVGLVVGAYLALRPTPLEAQLRRGREHLAAKRYAPGVRELCGLLTGKQAEPARAALGELLAGPLREAPTLDAADALVALAEFPVAHELMDSAQDAAWVKLAVDKGGQDPREALTLLHALAPLAREQVAKVHEPALQAVLARFPDDLEAASELGLLYEQRGELERCGALLEPFAARLKTPQGARSEGARLLGAALRQRGDRAGAEALWSPYVDAHLPDLASSDAALETAFNAAAAEVQRDVEQRRAPQAFYTAYEQAGSEDERQAVRERYLRERVRRVPAVRAAVQRAQEARRVVPVALEVGLARLASAQGLADPAARAQALEQVERLFLALLPAAEERAASVELNLAQVRYWLGRPAEGRKQLDDLLARAERAPALLVEAAATLRAVGALSDARALAEEACQKATDVDLQRGAATLRAMLATDVADKVKWLQRADPKDPLARAALVMAEGQLALEQGDAKVASAKLEDAVQRYAALPESPVTLNNGALALRALWSVSGERRYFDESVARLLRAEAAQPSDTVFMTNVADALLAQGALRQLEGKLDLARAKAPPGLDWVRYLTYDAAELDALGAALRQDEAVTGAAKRLDQLLLLAPRAREPAVTRLEVIELTRDPQELAALRDHLAKVELDLGNYRAQIEAAYRGDPPLSPAAHAAAVAERERTLASCREGGAGTQPATLAAALVRRVGIGLAGTAYGYAADPEQLVALAEEAYRVHPCLATHGQRHEPWALRAVERLAKQLPALASAREATRRSVVARYLLAALLRRPDAALHEALAKDEDVRRIGASLQDLRARFPKLGRPWWVPLLEVVDPAAAKELSKALSEDRALELALGLELRLAPLNATSLLESMWLAELQGKDADAEALLGRAHADKVPLPE